MIFIDRQPTCSRCISVKSTGAGCMQWCILVLQAIDRETVMDRVAQPAHR